MISAFLFDPPAEATRPSAVLVNIHGGPEAQAGPIVNPMMDMIRRRGIAVISPNVRGSAGYGKTFLTLDNGRLREDSVRDIGALLDWIATRPELDAERVAVLGGSYGGYMVLASAVHYGERLRCAFEMVGISNFVTFLENTEDYRRDLRRVEYGDERDPEMRVFLESISPSNHADKIRIPLFVFSGKNDPRVPVSEGRQIMETVRANGGDVWYMEAADEGHGVSKPQNMLYLGAAGLAFLEQCLLD
jgi:dipeptidyl aminopeptidase/acylaminoacyl peptidase